MQIPPKTLVAHKLNLILYNLGVTNTLFFIGIDHVSGQYTITKQLVPRYFAQMHKP